jgi:DNA-binding NarL/FixJ family response regulator
MLLEDEDDLEICGEAKTGRQAIELAGKTEAEVVVLDVNLPDMSGMEVTRAVKEHFMDTKVLILTAHDTEDYLLEAKAAGADGFLLKRSAPDRLPEAIRCVGRGEEFLDEEVLDR